MLSDGDPGGDVLDLLWSWSEQARNDRDPAGVAEEAQRRAASAREQAALAKHRELAAHRRAIELHEDAARLQERLGHADRAAAAGVRAQHARELYELAGQELQELARAAAGR